MILTVPRKLVSTSLLFISQTRGDRSGSEHKGPTLMLHNPFYAGAYVYGRTTTRGRCGSSAPCAEWRWHHARCTILGLLSPLLAFTYAFVAGRHDVRQALIVRADGARQQAPQGVGQEGLAEVGSLWRSHCTAWRAFSPLPRAQ
jgi:hypothetical protein